MANQVQITLKAEVGSNSLLSDISTYSAEAYDVINVTVAAGESDVEVSLVTGLAGDIGLLGIKADAYSESAVNTLSYKMHLDSEGANVLDRAQLFTGVGMTALFGVALDKIFLSNSGAVDRVVTIIIGRDVTPVP